MVAALAELDTRVVARASGRSDARDFARAVPLGWSDACSRRRIARAARDNRLVLDFPATLREFPARDCGGRLHVGTSSCLSFTSASTIVRGTDSPLNAWESAWARHSF